MLLHSYKSLAKEYLDFDLMVDRANEVVLESKIQSAKKTSCYTSIRIESKDELYWLSILANGQLVYEDSFETEELANLALDKELINVNAGIELRSNFVY